jgi:hypothetical protein
LERAMSVELFREDIAATIGRPKVNKHCIHTIFVPRKLYGNKLITYCFNYLLNSA